MKETLWGYWLILLGVFITVIMMLISSVTTQNTQDYYIIKEVTEAAMVDAVNYGYYRKYGELKIDREKFIESFLRRFAENVRINTYTIDFYDIYEAPPKVSVKVTSKSNTFVIAGDQTTFDVVNKVDAILELSGGTDSNVNRVPTQRTYTVRFNSDGVANIPNQVVARNGTATRPADPNRDGYNFVCWQLNGNCYNFSTPVTASITLSAKWSTGVPSIYDFIVNNATIATTGYYDCTNRNYCEKTSVGNLKYFVCSDYSERYHTNYDECASTVETIYSSLPERINK